MKAGPAQVREEHRHSGWGSQARTTPNGSAPLSSTLLPRQEAPEVVSTSMTARAARAAAWWVRMCSVLQAAGVPEQIAAGRLGTEVTASDHAAHP